MSLNTVSNRVEPSHLAVEESDWSRREHTKETKIHLPEYLSRCSQSSSLDERARRETVNRSPGEFIYKIKILHSHLEVNWKTDETDEKWWIRVIMAIIFLLC